MMETTHDFAMRMAAAEHVRRIAISDVLSSEQLAGGFVFGGERVPLVNPQRGIFKPRSMEHLLSIRTVFPRGGARVWYDDQRVVHEQVARGAELIDYAFMGSDPDAADNRCWQRMAAGVRSPDFQNRG
jgi:putative restriction endonuclease